MYSVFLQFCGIITLAGTNLLVLKLSRLASAKNLCVSLAIYQSQSSHFQSVYQNQFDVYVRELCVYVYIHAHL